MKNKKYICLCGAVFIMCLVIIAALTLSSAYSKQIIGGTGIATILFSLRQTIASLKGIIISGVGLLSLILMVALSIKSRS